MRVVFLLVMVAFVSGTFAQDDYPDFRSKKEMFSRVQEQDLRSELASFTMGGLDESIGKKPLKTIPVVASTANSLSFAGENIKVRITTAPFDPKKHKLNYFDPEKTYLVRIDNKPYFGDYGTVPKTTVDSVVVVIDADTVRVPKEACADLANPQLSFAEKGTQKTLNKVFISNNGKRIYVYLLKQEEGGSYEATWIIQDKKYLRRVVDFGFLK